MQVSAACTSASSSRVFFIYLYIYFVKDAVIKWTYLFLRGKKGRTSAEDLDLLPQLEFFWASDSEAFVSDTIPS